MAQGIRWRRALIFSFIFHMFFLGSAGFLTARALHAPAIIESYIELDLANEPLATPSVAPSATQAPPNPVTQPVPPSPTIRQPAPVVAAADHVPTEAAIPSAADDSATDNVPAAPAISSNTGGSSGKGSGGGGSSGKRGGVAPPSILSEVDVTYPAAARQAGVEGTVFLKVQVLANGRPGTISVSQSSGHDILDDAAIASVRQWRFVPAKDLDSGRAIACYITRPLSFRLK